MNELPNWDQVNNFEDEHLKNTRAEVNQAYEKNAEITKSQIENIHRELSQIPNLVINFDETMTETSTIDDVLDELCQSLPAKAEEIKNKREQWNIKRKDSPWLSG